MVVSPVVLVLISTLMTMFGTAVGVGVVGAPPWRNP